MSERYMTLLGYEQVQSAGHRMNEAAHTMGGAASAFDNAVDRQRTILDDFLTRFEALVERMEKAVAHER